MNLYTIYLKIIILMLLNTLAFSLKAQFNGTYSIGSTGDFTTVTTAIDSLIEVGVSGPVTFEIDSGNYSQSMLFKEIPGASETNHITFKSKDNRRSDVKFANSNSAIVEFDSADFITIKALTINCNVGNGVVIKNGAHHITIDSCYITGVSSLSTSRLRDLITNSDATVDNYTTIKNCTLKEGSMAILLRSPGAEDLEKGHVITSNTVLRSSSRDSDIYINGSDSVLIANNTITSNVDVINAVAAILVGNSKQARVLSNKIVTKKRPIRIISAINNTTDEYTLVANNMIHCTGIVFYDHGISIENNNTNVKIYHNSLYLQLKYNYGGAFMVSDGSNTGIEILNNNVQGNCMMARFDGPLDNILFDYNNLNKLGGGYYMVINGSWMISKEAAIDRGFKEKNNVEINPNFTNANDLHANNAEFGNLGTPLALVPTDFDGEPRNTAMPDMGADEFDPANALDLKLSELFFDNEPLCSKPASINLRIKNIGNDTVTSFNIVKVINDTVVDTTQVTQSLPSYSEIVYPLVYPDFEDGDTLMLYIAKVNGLNDADTTNNVKLRETWMAHIGNIIVGPDPADISLKNAANELNTRGICGDVKIIMKSGIYDDYAFFNDVKKASEENSITIESETGNAADVVIAAKTLEKSATIENMGTDLLTVKNITIMADTGIGHGINFYGKAHHNTFENLVIYADSNGSYSGIYSKDADDNYTLITNCRIYNGDYCIALFGNKKETGAQITNNLFEGKIYTGALYAGYVDSLLVKNNTMQNIDTNFNPDGFYIEEVFGKIEVTNNIIDIQKTTGNGMYYEYFHGNTPARSLIANNIIYLGGTPDMGIYFYEIGNLSFINNTIRITGNINSQAVYFDYFSIIEAQNNNICALEEAIPLYFDGKPVGVTVLDYNNIYSENGIIAFNERYFHSFADWQLSGWDEHSISVDAGLSGYYPCNTALNAAGTSANLLPAKDIFGKKRTPAMVDIGAVEISSNIINLGQDFLMCEENYTLDAGSGASSYLWNTGETTQTITVTSPGQYTVEITGICETTSKDTLVISRSELTASALVETDDNWNLALINKSEGLINKYTWNYDFGASNEENTIVALPGEGTYNISLKVENECRSAVYDTVLTLFATGIKENNANNDFNVYPNPANDLVQVSFTSDKSEETTITLSNLAGQVVISKVVSVVNGKNVFPIDLSSLTPGVYVVNAAQGMISPIIKQ